MSFEGTEMKRPSLKKKFTVEFNDDIDKKLTDLAQKKGINKVDVLRRAIALYDYTDSEAGSGTFKKLSITENGRAVKDIVLP